MPLKKRRKGKTHYTSAGAFAQVRLDRYIEQQQPGDVPQVPLDPGYGGSPSEPPVTGDEPPIAVIIEETLGVLYSTNFNSPDPDGCRVDGLE